MKNKMLFRSIFSFVLIASCFAKAEPAEDTLRAECRVQSELDLGASESKFSDFYGQELIRFYNPFGAAYVIIGENDPNFKVDAIFTMDTWISYRVSFDFKGEKVVVFFSNHLSPSLGKMIFPDGRSKFVACTLILNS